MTVMFSGHVHTKVMATQKLITQYWEKISQQKILTRRKQEKPTYIATKLVILQCRGSPCLVIAVIWVAQKGSGACGFGANDRTLDGCLLMVDGRTGIVAYHRFSWLVCQLYLLVDGRTGIGTKHQTSWLQSKSQQMFQLQNLFLPP